MESAVLAQVTVETSSTGFGGASLIIQLVFIVIFLGIGIYTAVDANKYPDQVWQATGQNKTLFMILPIVMGLCCGIFVLIPVLIYFLSVKKKLDAAGGGGYGGYPPQ